MLEVTLDGEARGAIDACLNRPHKEHHMHNQDQTPARGLAALLRTPQGAALAAVLTAALIYLLVDHTTHVLRALPYLLVLLCPLMHLFMMRRIPTSDQISAATTDHLFCTWRRSGLLIHVTIAQRGLSYTTVAPQRTIVGSQTERRNSARRSSFIKEYGNDDRTSNTATLQPGLRRR